MEKQLFVINLKINSKEFEIEITQKYKGMSDNIIIASALKELETILKTELGAEE